MENQQDTRLTRDLMSSLGDAYASMYISEKKKPLTQQERDNKEKPTNVFTDIFTGDSPERRAARRAQASGDKAGIERGKQKERERVARIEKEKTQRSQKAGDAAAARGETRTRSANNSRPIQTSPAKDTTQDDNKRAQQAREKKTAANEYYRKNFASTEGSKNTDPKKNINPKTGKPFSETPGKSTTAAGATMVDKKDNINPKTGKPFSETPGKSTTAAGATTVKSTRSTDTDKSKDTPAKNTTVLAKKDGVEGKLDKSTGKFTAGSFSDKERNRYSSASSSSPSSSSSSSPSSSSSSSSPSSSSSSSSPSSSSSSSSPSSISSSSPVRSSTPSPSSSPAPSKPTNALTAGGSAAMSRARSSAPSTPAKNFSGPKTPFKSKRLGNAIAGVKKFRAENYDAMVRYMIGEGYAIDEDSAKAIVEHMSDAWVADLMG